jgi:hypothetical protein
LQIAHIKPWSKVKKHEFDNLILLCAICHDRFDRGEIDKTSMRAYKANLGLLKGRYGDLEIRVLEFFAKNTDEQEITIDRSHTLLLQNLVDDGLLYQAGDATGAMMYVSDDGGISITTGPAIWRLTDQGRDTVRHLSAAERLN